MMMQFDHIQIDVFIDTFRVNKLYSLSVVSSSETPIDLANIEIPAEYVEVDAILKGMSIKIFAGYYGSGTWLCFSGLVKDVSWGRTVNIYCKDLMETLRQEKNVKSFVDASPAVIMKYLLVKAGADDYALSDSYQPLKHYFVLSNQNILQAQRLMQSAWGLQWLFYREPEGQIVWQPLEETERFNGGEPVLTLEYGVNLLELVPTENSQGYLRTFLLPFLRHGQVITVIDRRYWASDVDVLITKVNYLYKNDSAEMIITWRILNR